MFKEKENFVDTKITKKLCGTPTYISATFDECHFIILIAIFFLLFRCLVISNNLYSQIELKTSFKLERKKIRKFNYTQRYNESQLIKQKQHIFFRAEKSHIAIIN